MGSGGAEPLGQPDASQKRYYPVKLDLQKRIGTECALSRKAPVLLLKARWDYSVVTVYGNPVIVMAAVLRLKPLTATEPHRTIVKVYPTRCHTVLFIKEVLFQHEQKEELLY